MAECVELGDPPSVRTIDLLIRSKFNMVGIGWKMFVTRQVAAAEQLRYELIYTGRSAGA